MPPLRVAIIGTGRRWKQPGATGFGMAHLHVPGYKASPDCKLVALADIKLDNAKAFQAEHGGDAIYTDYREMLAKEKPDVVSICTWTGLHPEMVIACAEAGVRAIHCEKPMAPTFGEARKMLDACRRSGSQLSFDHQRRFNAPYRKARELLRQGAIGKLLRIETSCSNLFDWGTHWFDMMFFYNEETPAKWVLGQMEPKGGGTAFAVPLESQGISHIKFTNGVHGLMVTGYEAEWGAEHRLIGDEGVIEVGSKTGGSLRVLGKEKAGWQKIETDEGLHVMDAVGRGILDVIDALKNQREPELSAERAFRATELIFATYESSRRRGRVDLPLTIEDSPLIEMLKESAP